MEKETVKKGRGGARPNSGRPKGIKKPYSTLSISMPSDVVEEARKMATEKGLSIGKLFQYLIAKERS